VSVLSKSLTLVFASFMLTWMLGLYPSGALWLVLLSLFVVSRFDTSFPLFRRWSWLKFLSTMVGARLLPLVVVFFTPGF